MISPEKYWNAWPIGAPPLPWPDDTVPVPGAQNISSSPTKLTPSALHRVVAFAHPVAGVTVSVYALRVTGVVVLTMVGFGTGGNPPPAFWLTGMVEKIVDVVMTASRRVTLGI